MDNWIEVSLTVDGELAEAVAETLARFTPDGVVIESTAVTAEADDTEGRPVGPVRVYGYIPLNAETEAIRRRLEEALWYLGRIQPLPEAQYKPIPQTDWSEAWKQHFRPIAIGKKLMIVPAWLEIPAGKRIAVRIDPGMAFGTGTHPTTQLCLELIEEALQTDQTDEGTEVIDIGCGSGILSIAALKLGARRALGVDIDADAIQAARDNAQLNGVAERLELGLASLAEIRAGSFSLRHAHLALANILAPVLVRLLEEGLGELLLPGGRLVLSGILAEQCTEVEAALINRELRIAARRQINDWVALLATRDGA